MSVNLFGEIGLADSVLLFQGTIGNEVVWDVTQRFLDQYNRDLDASVEIFVSATTDKIKDRFMLPARGRMQLRGRNGEAANIRRGGSWDVAFPLNDYSAKWSADDVTLAYMTAQEYSAYLIGVNNSDVDTYRYDLLRPLLNNTQWTAENEWTPSVTCYPLANGDSTVYPPVLGSSTEATANGYAVTGYDSSLISSTNNPITAGVDYLQNWFGTPTGGSNIALFIPKSEKSLYKALPDFVPIQYQHVHPGVNTATVIIPGVDERLLRSSWEVIGTCNGTIVCSWAQIPATYGLMVHLDDDGPLKERMDLLTTKLGRGLQLVAKDMDDIVKKQTWRRRFGLGCGNRLNGYVYQNIQTVTTSGSTAAGSTSISLTAGLTTKLPIGTTFNFGTVSSPIWAVLTTAAAASDTSLTVAATSAIIADATKSTYGTPAAYQ